VTEILRQLMTWLVGHAYAVVFLCTLIDATAIPFPGRIVLVAAGAFAAAGDTSVLLLIALGAAGVIITDHAWYFAGGLGGRRLLHLYCWLSFGAPDCVERARGWLERYGTLTIVVGRFVAAVRVVAWPLARDHGVGYPTFVALEVPAALLWTTIWVGLGWLLGDRWAQASSPGARWIGIGLAAAAVPAMIAFRLWRRRAARATTRRETAARAFPGSPAAPPARPRP
jgi:membrane protein DedA with SNARE-associated domain